MSSREHDGAPEVQLKVRLSPHAELIRERIAERRPKLDELLPVAVDLQARLCEVLHNGLAGRLAELSMDHSERFSQAEVTGERELGTGSLCKYLAAAPEVVLAALDALLEPLGYRVAPREGGGGEVLRANVDLMGAVATLQGAVSTALEDGRIDDHERRELRGYARELRVLAEHLEGAC